MRVSRTRFSKRRSKRKTEFPIVAIIKKKRKVLNKPLKTASRKDRERVKLTKPQKKSRATIDYKNVILLRNLITAEGKILPRRINKLTAKQQRHIQKAIKSARIMGLIPFINKSRPFA
uniref:ribosomal protein S18 n=1 Tax=Polulichloris maxima TaxID=2704661 RepID=UPI002410D27F|nr:ribosomal protein S18 [Polulichloris maxima]WDY13267.1 ribosomal protein S18 [Polulichloris maxima]